MPRVPRRAAPGILHHLLGSGRGAIFPDRERAEVLGRLARRAAAAGVLAGYAWARMPNHARV